MSDYPKYLIRRVIPPERKAEALEGKTVCLGISLDNSEFTGKHLHGIFAWIGAHYENCLVFIGDHLYQYTLRMCAGMGVAAAETAAAEGVEAFRSQASPCLKATRTTFQLVTLSELSKRADFTVRRGLSEQLYQEDEAFRSSIDKSANDYVKRKQKQDRLTLNREEAFRLSIRYLLDEITFYELLASDGWLLEVYPGSEVPVLREIIQGKLRNAPDVLKKRVFVELRKAG